jgi:hypothetical protein
MLVLSSNMADPKGVEGSFMIGRMARLLGGCTSFGEGGDKCVQKIYVYIHIIYIMLDPD